MHEALYYVPLGNSSVRCTLCPRMCVIPEGGAGVCRVRVNRGGKLYAWTYGKASSVAIDPIEKKPLYNFYPGSDIFSVGTVGCNFSCLHCQNWEISQAGPGDVYTRDYPPEKIINDCLKYKCGFIAFTYNEPTVSYEYMLDTFKLAKERDIRTVSVTNGYISKAPLKELIPYLDAANVDVKAFSEDFYRDVCGDAHLKPVLRNVEEMVDKGVHVEVTYLIIPGYNDDEKQLEGVSKWLSDLNPDVPLHFTRFYPQYKMLDRPATPVETLVKARRIALKNGLRYVYTGNYPGLDSDNTYCPSCGRPVIRRYAFSILELKVTKDGRCSYCGSKVNVKL